MCATIQKHMQWPPQGPKLPLCSTLPYAEARLSPCCMHLLPCLITLFNLELEFLCMLQTAIIACSQLFALHRRLMVIIGNCCLLPLQFGISHLLLSCGAGCPLHTVGKHKFGRPQKKLRCAVAGIFGHMECLRVNI